MSVRFHSSVETLLLNDIPYFRQASLWEAICVAAVGYYESCSNRSSCLYLLLAMEENSDRKAQLPPIQPIIKMIDRKRPVEEQQKKKSVSED